MWLIWRMACYSCWPRARASLSSAILLFRILVSSSTFASIYCMSISSCSTRLRPPHFKRSITVQQATQRQHRRIIIKSSVSCCSPSAYSSEKVSASLISKVWRAAVSNLFLAKIHSAFVLTSAYLSQSTSGSVEASSISLTIWLF